MATVYVVTAGSGESYRIERVYLDSDQAYRFAQDYNGIAPVNPVSGGGMAGRCPAGRLRRPLLAGGVVGTLPVAKRRGALRHTDEGERFDDFAIRQEWWTGDALPEATVVRRELAGAPKIEVVGLFQGEGRGNLLGRGHPGQRRVGRSAQEIASAICAANGTKWAWRFDIAVLVRHHRLHGPTRSGTARPPRREPTRRTGLPQPHRSGQQPAVHRAHPGRHRARRAQGQRGHLRHLGEQAGLGTRQHRHHPGRRRTHRNRAHTAPQQPTPRPGYALRPTTPNALSQASTEELLLELRRRIIAPRDRRHTPGTTGTVASTRTATGPKRARSDG